MLRLKAIAIAYIALVALSVPAAAYGQQYADNGYDYLIDNSRYTESSGVRDLLLRNIESNNHPENLAIKVVGYFTPEELRTQLRGGFASGADSSWNQGGSANSFTGQSNNSHGSTSAAVTNSKSLDNQQYMSGGSSESGSSHSGPNGSGYSKNKSFNMKSGNKVTATDTKAMTTGFTAGTSTGTTAGSKWNSFGSQKGQTWAKGFVEEPEYLYGGFASGADSSWNQGGSANSFTGTSANTSGSTSAAVTNTNSLDNQQYMSGGSSESGSSHSGPNGSGYSKNKSFNMKSGNKITASNTKGMTTGFTAGSSTGTTAGSKWNSFGSQKGQTWAKGF